MTTCSRNWKVRSVASNANATLLGARSSAALSAQVADTDMATWIASIPFPDSWNNGHEMMVQETTNLPVTDLRAYDLSVLQQYDDFLYDNNELHETHSDVQMMTDSPYPSIKQISWGYHWTELFETVWRLFLGPPLRKRRREILALSTEL